MRSKKRQTNIQILNRSLDELSVQNETKNIQPVYTAPTPSPAKDEVKMIEKPKKARGAPKAALINTARLLTG